MRNLINKILKESEEEKLNRFYSMIASKLNPPYLTKLNKLIYGDTIEKKEIVPILSFLFKQPVKIIGNGVFNKMNNKLYWESSDGIWFKKEYDKNGNETYYEDSEGFWEKTKYNEIGDKIYREDSSGEWERREYDKKGNEIYWENSDGDWIRWSYDKDGKLIDTIVN